MGWSSAWLIISALMVVLSVYFSVHVGLSSSVKTSLALLFGALAIITAFQFLFDQWFGKPRKHIEETYDDYYKKTQAEINRYRRR